MKKLFAVTTALVMAGSFSLAYAANLDKGKALFDSPRLGGGTTGNSCQSCHAGGKLFGGDLFTRQQLTIMGDEKGSVAEIVNVCIEKALGGKAINPKGEEMQDLLAYMQSLLASKAGKK